MGGEFAEKNFFHRNTKEKATMNKLNVTDDGTTISVEISNLSFRLGGGSHEDRMKAIEFALKYAVLNECCNECREKAKSLIKPVIPTNE